MAMQLTQVPTNTIMFQEPTFGQKGQKMVDLSYDASSKTWSQRVIFQVCKNETEALVAPFGLSKPRDGQDASKRNLELMVVNQTTIDKFNEIDAHIQDYAFKNSKSLFRKELSKTEIEAKYKSILKWKEPREGYEGYHYIIVKTKCPPEKTPPIKVVEEGSKMRDGSIDDLTAQCKIVPIVRLLYIWFMTDSFGVTPQADRFIVFPGPKRAFLDDFILENDYTIS